MAFSFTVEKSGACTIFNLSGYMEKDHGKQIRMKVEELVSKGETIFILDFTKVPVVNSLGLAEMVDMAAICIGNESITIAFCGLASSTKFCFKTVGIFNYVDEYPGRQEAIAGCSTTGPGT